MIFWRLNSYIRKPVNSDLAQPNQTNHIEDKLNRSVISNQSEKQDIIIEKNAKRNLTDGFNKIHMSIIESSISELESKNSTLRLDELQIHNINLNDR